MDKQQSDFFGKTILLTERVFCIDDSPEEQEAWKLAGELFGKCYQEAMKEIEKKAPN